MKATCAVLLALSLGVAACSNPSSTAATRPNTAVSATPTTAPPVSAGTPSAKASSRCSQGVTSQNGGATDYLNCLNNQEQKGR